MLCSRLHTFKGNVKGIIYSVNGGEDLALVDEAHSGAFRDMDTNAKPLPLPIIFVVLGKITEERLRNHACLTPHRYV
ncbi:hypothetical protein ABRG53_3076 [Pseudanabaena sp. ABRG5-3]|nr:hypothetical protein ABRG53_3076 [Pseudanabaena sp. ABRG5-3]